MLANERVEGLLGHHVDGDAEQVSQVLLERDVIEQAASRLQGDEQVEVAAGPGFAPSRRAEHADVVCPVLLRKAQDRLALIRKIQSYRHDTGYLVYVGQTSLLPPTGYATWRLHDSDRAQSAHGGFRDGPGP